MSFNYTSWMGLIKSDFARMREEQIADNVKRARRAAWQSHREREADRKRAEAWDALCLEQEAMIKRFEIDKETIKEREMKEIFIHCTDHDVCDITLLPHFVGAIIYPFSKPPERLEIGYFEINGLRLRFIADIVTESIVKLTYKMKT